MKFGLVFSVLALLFGIQIASGESHPAWWRYASQEATALVGLQWQHCRSSAFADAISGELRGDGGLGFPDLESLQQARQILISSPALLAMAAGDFSAPAFREDASRKGLKRGLYREVEIWVTPGKETLSVARISDQLILLAKVQNLHDAIDRSLLEDANRGFSPLLARAARYAQDDLWVVATHLPDDIADRFVPIDAEAEGFEGAVSLEGGLRLGAVLTASSEEAAAKLADSLKQMAVSLPPIARGIEVAVDQKNVTLSMAVSNTQLSAGLRTTSEPAAKTPEPVAKAAPKSEPAKPAGPQIVRIYGLDDGPREIVLRPAH